MYRLVVMNSLEEYKNKRDFEVTPEPRGIVPSTSDVPIFVIQKHDATRLHYDLRFEVDGVLKSWAVPKGPSLDPSVKRLAVATEDHPMDYANFEGVIPEGQYGAGPVIVWDTGTYENITTKRGKAYSMEEAIEHGHVSFRLRGKKLHGTFSLNRFRRGRQEEWLLIKTDDDSADPSRDIVLEKPESVLSGLTIEELEAVEANGDFHPQKVQQSAALLRTEHPDDMPQHLQPMLSTLSKLPSKQVNYGFEYKWDGIRLICYWDGRKLLIESRNGLDVTFRWPELTDLGKALGRTPAILDGELVAFTENGRMSFSLLAKRMHLATNPSENTIKSIPVTYMIFDILYLGSKALLQTSYVERRKILDGLDLNSTHWRTPPWHEGRGKEMLAAANENEMEGIIAKELDSRYEPGKRTGKWLKIKTINRQELVIGGWIPEKNIVERGVGALLTGYYTEGKLLFAGKVGTGFTDKEKLELRAKLEKISRTTNPFSEKVAYKNALFVEPVLVAEFEFREWTPTGRLRHPSYKGLRNDKDPLQVRLEQ